MDLTQSKLLRQEWESIEVPVESKEKQILKLMMDGYKNVSISVNYKQSLFSIIKMEKTPEIAYYLYKKYFEKLITDQINNKSYTKLNFVIKNAFSDNNLRRLKSADLIRLQNVDTKVNTEHIVEYQLIEMCQNIINSKGNANDIVMYIYTLLQMKKASILHINEYVIQYIDYIISVFYNKIDVENIIYNATSIIEQNPYLFQYEDIQLYTHQKEFYSIFHAKPDDAPLQSKLVLYSAPTGTGKTITPIGLLDNYKVIFVCVARHIGLSLAKAAISVERKVAFAFGCTTASDIRLHYYAAANYMKNKKSGGIGKVDNSDGSKVELMICDVESYITAMHYMISFQSDLHNIITYWDEPTITLDYETHELHQTIHRNWSQNKIPNMVFSCATLPKEDEIMPVIEDFREKFDHVRVYNIVSFDCKKSIPILNKEGFCVLPHVFYSEYSDVMKCVDHCRQNQTLLRYFDLSEIIRFIKYVNDNTLVNNEDYIIANYFHGIRIEDITMHSIKLYYLTLLKNINKSIWNVIHGYMRTTQKCRFQANRIQKMKSESSAAAVASFSGEKLSRSNSISMGTVMSATAKQSGATGATTTASTNPSTQGILITTADAYTLTDGPTIFLSEDVKKIGTFYVQQSNIPSNIFQNILIKMSRNNDLVSKITLLERDLAAKQEKTFDDTKAHKTSSLISNSKSEKEDRVVAQNRRDYLKNRNNYWNKSIICAVK